MVRWLRPCQPRRKICFAAFGWTDTSFSVSGYLMWLGHISPPPNSLFVLHPPLFSRPLHQPATASSLLLAVCKLGFDKYDELGIFGRLQRAGLESGMFPATPASSGRASVTLPWGRDVPAGKPGEPRGLENSKLSQAFGRLLGKRSLKLLSSRLQVKDFHLAVLVQQRLFYLCVSKPLKILLGHISGELIETLK